MMDSKVYLSEKIDDDSIKDIFAKALAEAHIKKEDKITIKLHFGEKGNTRFIHAEQIRPIIEELKKHSKNIFLTDANTLYRGARMKGSTHKKLAEEHGFGSLNTPIIIADGEDGDEELNIEINKPIFKKVLIAKAIAESDVLIVISHFKGHALFGFGGAIKNLGMGSASRAGKLQQHSKIKPIVTDRCIACKKCAENCPVDAITVKNIAVINERCIGCAKCIAICPVGAIDIPWRGNTSDEAMERCAEYAFGAQKEKRCIYINFINNITEGCDCMPDSRIIGKDIGIMSSLDPVAVDSASYNLTIEKNGSIFKRGTHILDYAENIGLGKKTYSLQSLD